MNQNPYTRVGDLIIAVNPFQWRKELYSHNIRDQYVSQLIDNGTFYHATSGTMTTVASGTMSHTPFCYFSQHGGW